MVDFHLRIALCKQDKSFVWFMKLNRNSHWLTLRKKYPNRTDHTIQLLGQDKNQSSNSTDNFAINNCSCKIHTCRKHWCNYHTREDHHHQHTIGNVHQFHPHLSKIYQSCRTCGIPGITFEFVQHSRPWILSLLKSRIPLSFQKWKCQSNINEKVNQIQIALTDSPLEIM